MRRNKRTFAGYLLSEGEDAVGVTREVSVSVLSLGVLTWGIAVFRREGNRVVRMCVPVLLTLYTVLQLLMV